jgi:hypothetical protein
MHFNLLIDGNLYPGPKIILNPDMEGHDISQNKIGFVYNPILKAFFAISRTGGFLHRYNFVVCDFTHLSSSLIILFRVIL